MSFLTSPEAGGERDRVRVWGGGETLTQRASGRGSEQGGPTLMSVNAIKTSTAWKRHPTSSGRLEK